ncbi:MAG: hypothetical protein HY763_02705 [Planctomycetes bacterium]|nr:hypothetical protein [Planctomycetota bacterium]
MTGAMAKRSAAMTIPGRRAATAIQSATARERALVASWLNWGTAREIIREAGLEAPPATRGPRRSPRRK